MWDQINRYLPEFDTAVLTGFDTSGRPFSLRCQPLIDDDRVVRLQLPAYIELLPGPANLLCHRHDERLWNLKSFALRGLLERDDGGWLLRPEVFIPGAGIGGLMSYVRFLRSGRRTTRRYLKTRNLDRPRVPWDEWQEVFDSTSEEKA